ncbi:MAG TPA: hypothetical protein VN696_03000 [Pyrinomonadaceae bacterium]|nr:hypothetical protein [Pyrinomonadaceae bacterium]
MNVYMEKQHEETRALRAEALSLGIVIPRDPGWWWYDDDVIRSVSSEMWDLIKTDNEYLTDIGKAGTRRLIREERNKLKEETRKDIAWARQQTQWTLTKWGVIIGWVLGLAGILIAIFKH